MFQLHKQDKQGGSEEEEVDDKSPAVKVTPAAEGHDDDNLDNLLHVLTSTETAEEKIAHLGKITAKSLGLASDAQIAIYEKNSR